MGKTTIVSLRSTSQHNTTSWKTLQAFSFRRVERRSPRLLHLHLLALPSKRSFRALLAIPVAHLGAETTTPSLPSSRQTNHRLSLNVPAAAFQILILLVQQFHSAYLGAELSGPSSIPPGFVFVVVDQGTQPPLLSISRGSTSTSKQSSLARDSSPSICVRLTTIFFLLCVLNLLVAHLRSSS